MTGVARGGAIALDAAKPRGLPLRRPLYGLGPYDFTQLRAFVVGYTCSEEAIRGCLPQALEPLDEPSVSMAFFHCPEVTGMGPHDFAMPLVTCRCADYVGLWVPYLYTSTDASLACYRECQGWPAVLADVELTEAGGQVRARVLRQGRVIIAASGEVGGDPITELDLPPIILYKEIPSIDGVGTDVAFFVTSTSKFSNVALLAGSGTLSFPEPGDDPVAELVPQQITSALYGSMDDHYPETIRRLDPSDQ